MVSLIELKGVNKSYAAAAVLADVDLAIAPSRVVGLVGANGAGKSTLLKILSGAVEPDSGELRVRGEVARLTPLRAHRLGIAMVHQETALVPQMTCVQNLALGVDRGRWGFIAPAVRRPSALAALRKAGYTGDPDEQIRALPVAQRQLVEIARALHTGAKVLAFDEPTSALSPFEAEQLFATIRSLRDAGCGIVYVSHRLHEILSLCDDITVLRDGRVVRTFGAGDWPASESVLVEAMLGAKARAIAERDVSPRPPHEAPALRVTRLTAEPWFRDIGFEVHRGEVVGVFGLIGAGRSEMLGALFGAIASTGEVEVAGKAIAHRTPRTCIAAGLALVPEDRKTQGLVLNMSVASNVTLPFLPGTFGVVRRRRQRRTAVDVTAKLALTRPVTTRAGELSGGNQQKALVGRWLTRAFPVYLFDEPTRGIDVDAKAEIYAQIERLRVAGCAVVVVSSEAEEILHLAHRVLVMHEGRIVADLPNDQLLTERSLLAHASGLSAAVREVAG